jgi:predicted TIM-barrel fold metal-dependent hydrolase
MAKQGFKILDSDMHVMEPPDLWERYIDAKYKSKAPRGVTSENVRDLRMVYPDGRDWARKTIRSHPGQCVVSVEPDKITVKEVIERMGSNNIVFSTDYPHGDSKYPEAVDRFLQLPLPSEAKRKILWDNCAAYYALENPQ